MAKKTSKRNAPQIATSIALALFILGIVVFGSDMVIHPGQSNISGSWHLVLSKSPLAYTVQLTEAANGSISGQVLKPGDNLIVIGKVDKKDHITLNLQQRTGLSEPYSTIVTFTGYMDGHKHLAGTATGQGIVQQPFKGTVQ